MLGKHPASQVTSVELDKEITFQVNYLASDKGKKKKNSLF